MASIQRPQINQVFTPRRGTVNRDMYIERPELELALKDALEGCLHIVLYGESGGGKSWLYKKVLQDLSAVSTVANCADVATLGTVGDVLRDLVGRDIPRSKVAETETKEAEVGIAIAKGGIKHTAEYAPREVGAVEACFSHLRKKAADAPCILVFDNLESIFSSQKLMAEVGNIITLLDDEHYSKFNIKLLLVGVPSDIRYYYQHAQNQPTIANRLIEIPEVSRLSNEQVSAFVYKGFVEKLKIKMQDDFRHYLQEHIYFVTAGIPERMHEYCETLARVFRDQNWNVSRVAVLKADKLWMRTHLTQCYTTIDDLVHSKGNMDPGLAQVFYCLGKVPREVFRTNDVETVLRREFSKSVQQTSVALLRHLLSKLASAKHQVIKKSTTGSGFFFADPRFIMCIRAMFYKNLNDQSIIELDRRAVQLEFQP